MAAKHKRTPAPRAHRTSTSLPWIAFLQAFFTWEGRLSHLRCYQRSTIPKGWSSVTGQSPGRGLWESGAELAAWHCQVPINPSQRSLWPSLCSEQGLEASGDNMALVTKTMLLECDHPWVESQPCHRLSVVWASYKTTLSWSFLMCKGRIITVFLQ